MTCWPACRPHSGRGNRPVVAGWATTYATLNERVVALAARLSPAVARRGAVAVLAWNCPAFLELIYAVPASGKILVPLNARLAPAELIHQLQSAGVTTLFGDSGLLQPLLREGEFDPRVTAIDLDAGYEQWLARGQRRCRPRAPMMRCDSAYLRLHRAAQGCGADAPVFPGGFALRRPGPPGSCH